MRRAWSMKHFPMLLGNFTFSLSERRYLAKQFRKLIMQFKIQFEQLSAIYNKV